MASIINQLKENEAVLQEIRRDIHAHPELSFQEIRTSDLIAKFLTECGIPIHRGMGKTGVIGIIKAGNSTRSIGLRADMDALPIQELNTFAYASRHSGKMHACGHDGHVTMLLAAAQYLSKNRTFDGTVYLIFQPAEEGGGGAKEMIKDGLFEQFPMEAIFGIHNWPGLEEGQFAVSPGPVMASSSEFKIVVKGKGGHAAIPQHTIDPIPIVCQLIQAFQTIISRNKKPIDAGVISVTMVHAGEATNVIPDQCELKGTVRTFSIETLDLIEQRMETLTKHICQAYGADSEFEFFRNYPPTINHTKESEFVKQLLIDLWGANRVVKQEPTMGAEDFSFMLQECPGAYIFIGNGSGEHRELGHAAGPCVLHNPSYDFNDNLISVGGAFWVHLVEAWLGSSSQRK
jgi:hippurate hydrolase